MTKGRASLLGLMRRYLAAVMDTGVSLLEIHKLLYFMQEGGEDLRLRYGKGVYGPYARNLRHVLSRIEGHFVIGYGAGDDRPDTQIEALPGAWERADEYLAHHPETRARFHRVADLISGFETPSGWNCSLLFTGLPPAKALAMNRTLSERLTRGVSANALSTNFTSARRGRCSVRKGGCKGAAARKPEVTRNSLEASSLPSAVCCCS